MLVVIVDEGDSKVGWAKRSEGAYEPLIRFIETVLTSSNEVEL